MELLYELDDFDDGDGGKLVLYIHVMVRYPHAQDEFTLFSGTI